MRTKTLRIQYTLFKQFLQAYAGLKIARKANKMLNTEIPDTGEFPRLPMLFSAGEVKINK
jgi:hypothetical protein